MFARLRPVLTVALLCFSMPALADVVAVNEPLLLPVARPHGLGRVKARERVEQLLQFWRSRYGVKRSWQGDAVQVSGAVLGVPFQAKLVVLESEVAGATSDPGFLLRGPALDYIQRKLNEYLLPSNS